MSRRMIIAGNWKMNKTPSEAVALIEELKPLCVNPDVDVVFCVPAIGIIPAVQALEGTQIAVGAENMYYDEKGAYTERKVQRVKFFKNMVILKLEGIESMNDAELYRQCDLLVDRENAIPLEEGEYYIADLIGLRVISDEKEDLGKLTDVMQTGANDVYVVEGPAHGEILIPVIDDCVLDIDLEKGEVLVHLLPGLIDEE